MLEQSAEAIVQRVVIPLSGLDRPNGVDPERNYNSNIFMNGTGVLRLGSTSFLLEIFCISLSYILGWLKI